MRIKRYGGTLALFILSAIMFLSMFLPWIEIKSEASAIARPQRMHLWIYSNLFGTGEYIEHFVYNETQEEFKIESIKADLSIYMILVLIGTIFYILDGILRLPQIKSKLEMKRKIHTLVYRYKFLIFLGALLNLIATHKFINEYPSISLNWGGETVSVSDAIIQLILIGTKFSEKYGIGGYFSIGPGIGFILAWIISFFIIVGWVYYIAAKILELRTSWRIALLCSVINILATTMSLALMIYGKYGIYTLPNYLTPEIMLNLLLSIFTILTIISLMLTYGKYAITRIEFLSLYLPPDEYRRRLKISTRYWFLSQNIWKIVLLVFITLVMASMFLTHALMITYDALRAVNDTEFGYTFTHTLHIASLVSNFSFFLLWISPIVYFLTLGVSRE